MEIHHRFMNVSTTGVTLLLDSPGGNLDATIRDLVVNYNEKVRNGTADLKTLEAFRMILCYKYQFLINSHSEEAAEEEAFQFSETPGSSDVDIKSFFIRKNESWNKEYLALLYEILVLQLVLHSSEQHFTKLFNNFHANQQESLAMSNERQNLCMRVSECFADSHNLHYNLYKKSGKKEELEEQHTQIQNVIKLWIKQEENLEWRLLASLLPKLAITFGSDKVISLLWDEVFSKSDDLGSTLTAVCVMADACFPCEKETVKEIHYGQCMQEQFWLILLQGLISGVSQHRKQALYLVKRAVDFMESHESTIRKKLEPSRESMVPFMCTRLPPADPSIEQTKKSFFLILEALEEKQKHLVLPALSHLPNLLKAYADHKSCGDCFNVIWLHCILRRILQHDNDAIAMFGLDVTLKADLDIFDETFLNFIANVLNNTFLYECDSCNDVKPQITTLLIAFFDRSEVAGVDLLNTFIRAISRVSWGPVALCWILNTVKHLAIQGTIVHNVWTPDELKCVGALVEKNLTMHCLQLRISSQKQILLALPKYARLPSNQSNLELIINTLSLFPVNEALSPNTLEWDLVSDHLFETVEPSDAARYITRNCDTFFTIERNIKSWSRIIALLTDSNLICRTNTCPAEKALRQLFQNLIDADLRPYADPGSILKVLELVSHLINLTSQSNSIGMCTIKRGMGTIKRVLSPYGNAIIKVLSRSLERKTVAGCDEYLLAITAFINSMNSPDEEGLHVSWWPNTEKQLERFEDKCIYIIANPDDFCRTQWSYAIKVLYLCREQTFSRRSKLGITYIPPLLRYFKSVILANDHEEETGKQNGRFTSDCFETIAKLLRQVITKSSLDMWPPNLHWLEEVRSLVETGSEEVIDPVATTLYELLEKNPSLAIQDLDTVNFIIQESSRCVFQLKRTEVFFSAVTQLTRLIVNSNFLKLDRAKEYAFEYVNQLMKEGECVPTLKQIFLTSVESLRPQDLVLFRKSFMSCLLHGKVPRRDQIIERSALWYIALLGDTNIDSNVRGQAIVVLLRIMTSPEATEFRANVLIDLLGLLEQNKNKRYFDNSHLHRLKHRVMQTLLILEPFLNETETQALHDTMCLLLIAESNQPSVRLMQEWILIRIYFRNSAKRDSIWTLLATAVEKRPGNIVSLASIIFHVSQLLVEDAQTNYIEKAIPHLLPNCMGQQFSVRLYSQAILVKIFGLLPADCSVAKKYRGIFEGVQESLRRGNLVKNSIRVLDNFYFTSFHPLNNYSLATIYYQLPRLTNVSDDEWIYAILFRKWHVDAIEGILPIYDEPSLRSAKAMMKSTKAAGELAEETDPSTEEDPSDIQKKIIPWKSMVPFYDELSENSKATLSRRKMQNEDAGIIVLASLVDRPPNLGGLARTCEIFGAKELVIGSLRYAEDRQFQTLSVSAEKWITITEVKPHLLQKYLLEKQSEGWKLVGAEQTANSTNLLEMEFDKKTILLLGNEKDGIPANLIPLLDTCVEIPQNGVVRSLNVHVTGAICIWQYVKQHIFK